MDQETVSLQPRMDVAELTAFLDAAFPMHTRQTLGEVVSIAPEGLRMRLDPTPSMARPGNIVSGPTLMALADCAAYLVIAAFNGPEAMAVTNALSISFLRACRFEPIFVDARLLKLGRRLASAEIRIWQRSEDRLIAHSTVGYALP
ncbi:PaaI family thioesterase [Acidocella sp.]|jgi:uncharacterized protein (TIGR00369 family)|uniref:PaaI family thioesterase n=1 Tax=Acidocella sp. TaxID=50710 RepID=UPI00260FBE1B|nr:PaaI family thioesterase [Acidocella sp.]